MSVFTFVIISIFMKARLFLFIAFSLGCFLLIKGGMAQGSSDEENAEVENSAR